MRKAIKHLGWAGARRKIERQSGYSAAQADRVLGAVRKKASPAAVRRNPRLKRTGRR